MRLRPPRASSRFATHVGGVVALLSLGCSNSSPGPVCIDAGVDLSCTPAYEATYDALYDNVFEPSCASPGFACHAATGRQGGLNFDDRDGAYQVLTRDKLRAGEPACSVLVHRIVSTDGKVRMPPGRSLPAGEQCAIVRWIADGAKR